MEAQADSNIDKLVLVLRAGRGGPDLELPIKAADETQGMLLSALVAERTEDCKEKMKPAVTPDETAALNAAIKRKRQGHEARHGQTNSAQALIKSQAASWERRSVARCKAEQEVKAAQAARHEAQAAERRQAEATRRETAAAARRAEAAARRQAKPAASQETGSTVSAEAVPETAEYLEAAMEADLRQEVAQAARKAREEAEANFWSALRTYSAVAQPEAIGPAPSPPPRRRRRRQRAEAAPASKGEAAPMPLQQRAVNAIGAVGRGVGSWLEPLRAGASAALRGDDAAARSLPPRGASFAFSLEDEIIPRSNIGVWR